MYLSKLLMKKDRTILITDSSIPSTWVILEDILWRPGRSHHAKVDANSSINKAMEDHKRWKIY